MSGEAEPLHDQSTHKASGLTVTRTAAQPKAQHNAQPEELQEKLDKRPAGCPFTTAVSASTFTAILTCGAASSPAIQCSLATPLWICAAAWTPAG